MGRAGGALLAPVTATLSAMRRARMFHPRGVTLRAEVRPYAGEGPWSTLAERLEGPALVRLSSAWWKRREWRDVLGVAIRFTRDVRADGHAEADDQDLLFATARRPWTTPFAPLSTDAHDFLANRYFAVSPFRTDAGIIEWRLVPDRRGAGRDRGERLAAALAWGDAGFWLEARPYRRAIHAVVPGARRPWRRIARVALIELVEVDQARLHFDPFRAGRGVEPVGFIHSLRHATYAASQWARPA